MYVTILIRTALGALKDTVKSKASKKAMRSICLEAFNTLKALYAGDKDFA